MAKRNVFYICAEPGPGKRFYLLCYYIDRFEPEIHDELKSQRKLLAETKVTAKEYQPSSIYVQGANGKYRLVNSYPRVVNRKPKKAA